MAPAAAQPPLATVHGTVSGTEADGQAFRIPGVAVQLSTDASEPVTVYSNDVGEYAFAGVAPGTYTLIATLDGFEKVVVSIAVSGTEALADLRLAPARVHEEVTVIGNDRGALRPRETAPPAEIAQKTIENVPVASEQFQSALPLVPGVVRGPDGTLNIKGARENQSGLRVSSASVTDPVTGEFAFRLPLEAIRSIQVVTNPYAPEYGQVTGGVTVIETVAGTDTWTFQVQDIEPRLRRRAGRFKGIESWTPRVAVGGPLIPSALTIFQSVEYQYIQTLVEGLPDDQGDTKLEGISSFTRVDWGANTANHVSAATAVFPQQRDYLGLNTFNPQSVTPNLHQSGYLWTTSLRRITSANAFLSAHVSAKRLDVDIGPSTSASLMILAPDRNAGSYFNTQRRDTTRYEGAVEYSTTRGNFAGNHLFKLGAGVGRDALDGDTHDRELVIVRSDGSRAEQLDATTTAVLSAASTSLFGFAQDTWSPMDRITIDFGGRYDRDSVTGRHHGAPRLGLSLNPDRRTVVRAGAGLFFGALPLNAAVFEQLPTHLVTRYADDGNAASLRLERPTIAGEGLDTPKSTTWNVEVDRELTDRFAARIGYQQRDGRNEALIDLPRAPSYPGALVLASTGRSRYRALEVTGSYRTAVNQLVVAYVRSSATGDLNDLNSYFGNVSNPIVRANEYSRLPFDAPNRVLAWGEFELPGGWGVAPLVEVRDGFPLSIVNEYRDFIGPRNEAGRFPTFFSLDLQGWKRIIIPWPRRLNARVGLKVYNVTNHFNPRDFEGNVTSSRFGQFSNGVSRTFRGKFVVDF